MPWKPDEGFLHALREGAEAVLRSMGLDRHLGDAFQDVCLYFLVNSKIGKGNEKKELSELPVNEQLNYLKKCIKNKAIELANAEQKCTVDPDKDYIEKVDEDEPIAELGNPSLARLVVEELDPIEQLIAQLLRLRFQQKQIAKMLGLNETAITRKKKRILVVIKKIMVDFQEGRPMEQHKQSSNRITDKLIYKFISGQEVSCKWNDNLRRKIRRLIRPLEEGLRSMQLDPQIPDHIHKRIKALITVHEKPPKIRNILDELANHRPITLQACMELLEAARQLNKPYLWSSPEGSLHAIENEKHANSMSEQLTKVVASALQISINMDNGPGITDMLCDKLKNWVDRFGGKNRKDFSPFESSYDFTLPLHQGAKYMQARAEKEQQKNIEYFNNACDAMKRRDDTENTIQGLQSIVDYAVRLLNWERFNAPRYLAPALLEEAIEVRNAVDGPIAEKRNVYEEIGDLLGMAIWLSNVLAIPNLGQNIIEYYKPPAQDKRQTRAKKKTRAKKDKK